jgi:NAD(P)-dependent dehydrogenase (short-subunit alcohol dehydrogenase family)
VLITGGASGIGESFVAHFAEQGARVAFLDVQDDAAEALCARLAQAGSPAPVYRHCDLAQIADVPEAVAACIEALGGLDTLVNNAGNDLRQKTDEVTPESWDRMMAINLRHQFFVTQAALPALRQSGQASVINLSSISWMIPSVGVPVYVTAKAGIIGLTRTLAHEVGKDNIRVNAILPGAIVTEKQRRLWLTPEYSAEVLANQALKRHLVPDEVARLALFLAADDSSAITAQSYIVDGGWV